MAKTQTASTLNPLALASGRPVLATGAAARAELGGLEVSQQVNYNFGFRRQCHLSLAAGEDGWGSSGSEIGTLALVGFTTSESPLVTDFIPSAEAALSTMTCGAVCEHVQAGTTARITFSATGNVGTDSDTIDCTNGDNGNEVTGTIDLTNVTDDGGWVALTISVVRQAGAGTLHEVQELNLEEDEVTSSLPDPL